MVKNACADVMGRDDSLFFPSIALCLNLTSGSTLLLICFMDESIPQDS